MHALQEIRQELEAAQGTMARGNVEETQEHITKALALLGQQGVSAKEDVPKTRAGGSH